MDKPDLNPMIIFMLYVIRCVIPLGIMLGVSYVLRRLGFIKPPPKPPAGWNNSHNGKETSKGGLTNG